MFSETSDENYVLEVSGISKTYRVWHRPIDRLIALFWELFLKFKADSTFVTDRLERLSKKVHALSPVDLKVKRGSAVGIIGRNGAGKSTLLQIVTGSLTPTQGTVTRSGKVAALLELGSGFNPECTGIENVKINATLLGLSDEELAAKMNSILEYADIGDFVHQAVKTYSSGMRMRLAFAVAAHVEADLIIIDEALGVGDARFQLKCAKTIEGLLEKGSSLLFVSHNMNAVKQLCESAILLHEGELLMSGKPNDVANIYSRITAGDPLEEVKGHIRDLVEQVSETVSENTHTAAAESESQDKGLKSADTVEDLRIRLAALSSERKEEEVRTLLKMDRTNEQVQSGEFKYGGELGSIVDVSIRDCEGKPCTVFVTGDECEIRMTVCSKTQIYEPIYALTIKDAKGQEVYVCNTLYRGIPGRTLGAGEKLTISFKQRINLMQGDYFISLGFVTFFEDELLIIQRRYDVLKLQVLPLDKCHGISNLYSEIEINNAN